MPNQVLNSVHSLSGLIRNVLPWAALLLVAGLVSGCGGSTPTSASTSPPQFAVLHAFTNSTDGGHSDASLIQGSDGNFYGITPAGGSTGSGTIFKISPTGTYTVLHSFNAITDGFFNILFFQGIPLAGGLIQGSDGNFYGTTSAGGSTGGGTVFSITPSGTFTVLHTFIASTDGAQSVASLVQASDGNFYGTTSGGGSSYGTIFKISPSGTFTVLHTFNGSTDGYSSVASLDQGSDGNLYGTTSGGGSTSYGTIFSIGPSGTFTVLHTLTASTDGGLSKASLIQGSDGNFYGTTTTGGSTGFGTIFKINPSGTLTVLHSFNPFTDGHTSVAGLSQASDGNFYGTTSAGGPTAYGTIFKISPSGTFTVLHTFTASTDGTQSVASLVQASDGNFYGTTSVGGSTGWGTIFQLIP